ncbi:MAG TPA: hypothetical protein VGH47_04275 [Xanthobacteraceae bacterium]|jgi:hypothetical protein
MRAPTHNEYADEAKRAAQRYLDVVAHNADLERELADWRNRALLAETEVDQIKLRELGLLAEVDHTRQTIAVIAAQYTTASKVLLDGFAAIDQLGGVRAKLPPLAIPPPPAEDPLPSIVAKGPITNGE